MADTQQIIVELIVDDSQLTTAIEHLEKTGQIDSQLANSFKQTTTELNKQATAIKSGTSLVGTLKKQFTDLAQTANKLGGSFEEGFANGVIDSLSEAGVSLQEFTDALSSGQTEVANSTESLRSRLKNLTQQLAQLKLSGEDNTEQFRALVTEAGRIKDAISDAGAEINNVASDTRAFDNLLGTAQAVAGGFAVAQGATALFGDESEDLQKTLLKVNAAMAILQGLQQVSNALQKEGAIVQLLSNKQRLITNAQLAIENGLQSTSAVVRLGAAAAQRILNAAMAANPILLFISALILVVSALAAFITSSRKAEIQTGELNNAVESATEGFENYAEQVKLNTEKITSELEKNGALQSKILEAQQKAEADINQKRSEEIARLRQFLTTSRDADEEAIKAANARLAQLNKERNEADVKSEVEKNNLLKQLREEDIKSQIASAETALLSAKEGSKQQLDLQKRLITLQSTEALNAAGLTEAEKTAIITKAQKDRQEKEIEFNKRQIDLQLKTVAARLVNVRAGTDEEFRLKIQQLRLQVQSEIQSAKLSAAEIKTIKENGFQEELKLTREHNSLIRKEAIEAQISLNNAELVNIKTNADDKLLLTVSNIDLAAALEIDAAENNAAKIKEINAKREADTIAARRASLEQQAQMEIDLLTTNQAAHLRSLNRIAGDEKKSTQVRIAAINEAAAIELDTIQKKEDTLKEELDQRLIDEKEFNVKYAQLQDEKKQVAEKAEEGITELTKRENELRKQVIEQAFSAVQEIFGGLNDLLTEQDSQRIANQKEQVNALLEAGAITEKEATARNKRIDAEERKFKREAAQRDKALAIFSAVINTAQAVTKALTVPPPFGQILAGIIGALGAAQIAFIAARPIPKFRTGKKNQYQGPGEIGEAGAELLQHNGEMYLAKSKSIVWLGKDDKVFNPAETNKMLNNSSMPKVDKEAMKFQPAQELINSEKFAAAVAQAVAAEIKNFPKMGLNVNEDGFKTWVEEGQSRKNYMDKQYSSK